MVNHRTAQIGPGQRPYQDTVINHGKSPDPAVDHHDRCPGEFVGRPDCRRVAHDQRVNDTVSESAASLQENTERVRERASGGGHVFEAGQHGTHQVLFGQRPGKPAVVIQDHQMADLGNADHLGCPPDGCPEPYVSGESRHDVAD